ncbi:MAG TPA: response regulator [Magnetospirillum sp.]|nr:response regulator [Magnetospirillum sp.]
MDDQFTILLVEDNALMRSLIRDMLRAATQFVVVEARDGSAALEILRQRQVDMVLSDWNMLPMNGLQLLHAMRTEPELASIPFVMMTGEFNPQTATQAVAAGVADFLTKPFGRDQLAKTITKAITGRPRAA